jgi:hypothetical protein
METSIEKRVREAIKKVAGDIGTYSMDDSIDALKDLETVRKIAAVLNLKLTRDDIAGIGAPGDFVDLMT